MKDFMFYSPVALYFGDECIGKHKSMIQQMGDKAFVITSVFANGCRNYALEDVTAVFQEFGIEYVVYTDVEENPTVESIHRVAQQIRAFDPAFIFTIGGGSALDTAKAANILIKYPEEADPYEVFYRSGPQPVFSQGRLPMFAVPTTAGSGSDTCGCAILTRVDSHIKSSMLQKSNFTAAFLDAKYVRESPLSLIDTGVLDALAHGVESYLSVRSTFASELIAEFGFRLFAEFKDNLLNGTLTDEDYEKMLIASSYQGMLLVLTSTTLPHGLGYPLSIHKHLNHGMASSITLGEYLRGFQDQTKPAKLAKLCGFESVDDFSLYINALIKRNVYMTVTESEIDSWTAEFMNSVSRLQNHPETVTYEDIKAIYMRSLKDYLEE